MTRSEKHPAAGKKRPLGIYLHIPFCKRKCLYCDFLSAPASESVIARYVDALCLQMEAEALSYGDFYVRTVFLGGGTPSLLSGMQLDRILGQLRKDFSVSEAAEITMECNPGTLDGQKLAEYRQAGVNRLSLGLQSANDAELKALGRIHSFQEFLENYEAARKAGFSNINVDLMSALPGQTPLGWTDTLERVAALSPEHISAYSLIIEEGTPFYERYGENADRQAHFLPLPSEDEERLMYEETQRILNRYGYHRYEISNYARPGRECLHNIGYWDRTDYVGFGLGAASMVDNVRWKQTEELEKYLRRDKAFSPIQRHALTRTEQMEEFMFLGLRLTEGISVGEFRRQFQIGIHEVYGTALKRLEQDGLLLFYEDQKRLKLTPRGVDVSNYVLAQFLLEEEWEKEE